MTFNAPEELNTITGDRKHIEQRSNPPALACFLGSHPIAIELAYSQCYGTIGVALILLRVE